MLGQASAFVVSTGMKTYRVDLPTGGSDKIEADNYKVMNGTLSFYRQDPASRRTSSTGILLIAYGPNAWMTFRPDEAASIDGQPPAGMMNEIATVLGRAMRFLSTFTNASLGLLHEDVQSEARTLKNKMSEIERKIAPFCDDEDEDDDED